MGRANRRAGRIGGAGWIGVERRITTGDGRMPRLTVRGIRDPISLLGVDDDRVRA
ncbi:hypothetical protein [Amycolatopsis sp. NPDC054798]